MSVMNAPPSPAAVSPSLSEFAGATAPQRASRRRSWGSVLALAAGAWLVGAASLGEARADSVYWSIGVQSPGVHVGVGNAPPVVVYQAPRRYYQPPHVVVLPPKVVYGTPYGHRGPPGWARHGHPPGHKHWKRGGWDDDRGARHGGYRGDYRGDHRGDHRGDKYAWDHRHRDGYRR